MANVVLGCVAPWERRCVRGAERVEDALPGMGSGVWRQIPRHAAGSSFQALDAGPSASLLPAGLGGLWPELA